MADAEEALRLGTPTARRVYNAARIYAQAALAVTSEVRRKGRDAVLLANKYQDRAVALASQAIRLIPLGRRGVLAQTRSKPTRPCDRSPRD